MASFKPQGVTGGGWWGWVVGICHNTDTSAQLSWDLAELGNKYPIPHLFECLDDIQGAVEDSKKRTEESQSEEEDVVASVRGQAPGWGTARAQV